MDAVPGAQADGRDGRDESWGRESFGRDFRAAQELKQGLYAATARWVRYNQTQLEQMATP